MLETAIIGGTGGYDPELLEDVREVTVDTVYGRVKFIADHIRAQKSHLFPGMGLIMGDRPI